MTDICSTCCVAPPTQVPSSARPSSVESRRRPRGPSRSGGSSSSVLFGRGVDRLRGSGVWRRARGDAALSPDPVVLGHGWSASVVCARRGAAVSNGVSAQHSCASWYVAGRRRASASLGVGSPKTLGPRGHAQTLQENRKRSRGVPWTASPMMNSGCLLASVLQHAKPVRRQPKNRAKTQPLTGEIAA